jgi:hypothetical protein
MARIEILKTWRKSGEIFHPGIYRIPTDISQDVADQAIRDQVAIRAADPEPKRKTKPVLGLKKPAPENKLLQPASENKNADASPGD